MTDTVDIDSMVPDLGPLPLVDQDRVNAVYEELKTMQVELDPNPIEFGPRRFNTKIAQVRAQLDRVESLFLQVSQDLHTYKRKFNETNSIYELCKNELMLNSLEVRQERSQKEREAKADTKLRKFLDRMRELELKVYDLEQLMVVIKAKRTDLKDKQGRMRDQMKMIDQDISLGSRWGSKTPPAAVASTAPDTDISSMLTQIDQDNGYSDDEDEEGAEEEASPEPEQADPPEPKVSGKVDVNSLIPEEGSKTKVSLSEEGKEDADSFLDGFEPEKKKEPVLSNPYASGSIEDLIGDLVDSEQ